MALRNVQVSLLQDQLDLVGLHLVIPLWLVISRLVGDPKILDLR